MTGEAEKRKDQGPLFNGLSALALLTLVFHLLMLWYRWLRPNPDFLEFTASVVQILTIGSFLGLQTEIGQRLVVRLDDNRLLKQVFNTPQRTFYTILFAATLAILMLYVGSPLAAEAYRVRGVTAIERGDYSRAVECFRQAISLDPKNARSHYNLATAYEALYEFEAAIDAYQVSLEYEQSFWPAYNNLGRLLISTKNEPEIALAVLLDGYQRADSQLGQAILLKNLAWAYAELGFTATASRNLDEVILALQDLRSQGENTDIYLAESYALRAKILNDAGDQPAALLAWQDSLGYALAVSESKDCRGVSERLPQYCFEAIKWAVAAQENIHNLTGAE